VPNPFIKVLPAPVIDCVSCLKDTSFGFGRFVNRIPATTENYEGYLCYDCQMVDCDNCEKETCEED